LEFTGILNEIIIILRFLVEFYMKTMKKSIKKSGCRHDYKNAIPVGKVDHLCPLCGKLLDPFEWFFMNSFEFVDLDANSNIIQDESRHSLNRQAAKEGGTIAGNARKQIEAKTGKKAISKYNFRLSQGQKKLS